MLNILIIEDEPAIANLIYVNLSDEGYRCVCAFDGKQGADLIEKETFGLILLDIMLPEIDGYELLEYIKPLGTPVIYERSTTVCGGKRTASSTSLRGCENGNRRSADPLLNNKIKRPEGRVAGLEAALTGGGESPVRRDLGELPSEQVERGFP